MNIKKLSLGAYQTNTYVLWPENGKHCLVIDPGYEADTILDFLGSQGLTLEAILLTHGHFDHVGAVKDLAADTLCRVFLHPAENTLPLPLTAGKLHYTDTYAEGSELTLAGLTFTVFHTPGHTPGSVCLCFGEHLFTGDTLFEGSCGRIDLPGGSAMDMRRSLKRLAGFQANYRVYPGHGGTTELRDEQKYNPYLR